MSEPKHQATPSPTLAGTDAGWWLPVTRREFNARMDHLEQLLRALPRIDDHLVAVEQIITEIGAQVSEATDLLAEINTETNDVSTRLDDLVAQLAAKSDASPEVLDGLRAISTRLQGLAADPGNPVPDPGPLFPPA